MRRRERDWVARSSEDEFDDFLGDEVRRAEVEAGDCDEAEHDGGRLGDLPAIRPLHALQLGPAGAQKADDAVAAAQGSPGRPLASRDHSAAAAARAARAAVGGELGSLELVLGPGPGVDLRLEL